MKSSGWRCTATARRISSLSEKRKRQARRQALSVGAGAGALNRMEQAALGGEVNTDLLLRKSDDMEFIRKIRSGLASKPSANSKRSSPLDRDRSRERSDSVPAGVTSVKVVKHVNKNAKNKRNSPAAQTVADLVVQGITSPDTLVQNLK